MTEQQPNNDDFQDPLQNYEPRQFDDPLEEALAENSITEVQAEPYVSVSADTSVGAAIQTLVGEDVACAMVEENGKLVGVFSDRDVLDKVALEFDAVKDRPVRELMTTNPVYVCETDTPAAALAVMAVSGFRHVPLVKLDETILGIISPQRVIKFLREHSAE